jgi:uncharacterized repeat protein (TIGR01451 family)
LEEISMRRPLALSATAGLVLALLVAGTALGGAVFGVTVTKDDTPDPVVAGTNLTYTIEVELTGGDGHLVQLNDTLPAGTTFVSFTTPGGWSATTPAVGGTGNVNASITDLVEGLYSFTLVVQVDAGVSGGTVLTNTATVDLEDDNGRPVPQASGSADTTVQAAPTPTPAASLADAAMAAPNPANLIATTAFGLLLISALGALAYASVRRRSR